MRPHCYGSVHRGRWNPLSEAIDRLIRGRQPSSPKDARRETRCNDRIDTGIIHRGTGQHYGPPKPRLCQVGKTRRATKRPKMAAAGNRRESTVCIAR